MALVSKLFLFALGVTVVSKTPGSALFPFLQTASSANGNFLVTKELTLGPDLGGGARQIEKETFHIQQRIQVINTKDIFQAAARFWNTVWSFEVDAHSNAYAVQGNFALVTDDGEAVVLVNVAPAMSAKMEALRIYHHTSSTGPLVRNIPLSELWTPEQIGSIRGVFTDASPQWFAGGSFNFSPDNQKLIVGTTWGNRVVINLVPH